MKNKIIALFAALLLAGSLNASAQKLPKKEYVNIPSGRNIEIQPSINRLGRGHGTVAVDIVINRKGDVISAHANKRYTTVREKNFVRKVEEAVMGMKFNRDRHAPEMQSGSLMYNFK